MALGTRIAVIMFSITVVLLFAQPTFDNLHDYDGTVSSEYISGMGYTVYEQNGTPLVSPDKNTTAMGLNTQAETDTGVVAGIIQFFTTFPIVSNVFNFISSVFFAPVNVLSSLDAPLFLQIAVGGIWTMLYIIAIASWIWRKDF